MADLCDACGGEGKPVSGLPCICGGTGRGSDEKVGLRMEVNRLETELQQAQEKIERLRTCIKEIG